MNKFLLFLCSIFLLMGSTVFALPMVGNKVVMHADYGDNYGMYVKETQITYDTFCLEKREYFRNGKTYIVDSVSMYAEEGGRGAVDGRDLVSEQSLWLYASFFDGKLGSIENDYERALLAKRVQNAIWFAEDEIRNRTDYDALIANTTDFTVTGWNIMAVNIVKCGKEKQSQLVGETSPVPEPATMVLLGVGLFSLAGLQRRRKNN